MALKTAAEKFKTEIIYGSELRTFYLNPIKGK